MGSSKESSGNARKEVRNPGHAPVSRNNTVVQQGENQVPKGRMPHEHDQSSDSQSADAPEVRRMGEIAHDSARRGERDTTKGAELDATYHEVRKEKKSPGG